MYSIYSIAFVTLLGVSTGRSASAAGCENVYVQCAVDSGGITTGVTSQVLDRAKHGLDLQTGEADKRVWEYTSVTTCANNVPRGPNADLPCLGAIQACAGNTPQQGQGPQVQLFRREVDAKNAPMGEWQPIGTTCFPQLVPGKPVLGMGLILAAFHNTAWALPTVHIQPEGNVTLVTRQHGTQTLSSVLSTTEPPQPI